MLKKLIIATGLIFTISTQAAEIGTVVTAETTEGLNTATYVEQVVWAVGQSQEVKLFSLVGGDPAINPVQLYVAVFVDVEQGYKVYSLGMMESFELVQNTKDGYLKINVKRTTMDSEGEELQENAVLFVNITEASQGKIWTKLVSNIK